MVQMFDLLKKYSADESGATAIEYGLLAALIGMGILVGGAKLAANTDSAWNNLADKVETATN